MNEEFLIKLNATVLVGRYSLQEAIDICRRRAMSGEIVELYARSDIAHKWTLLGRYEPSGPIVFTDSHTGERVKVACCLVTPIPPKRYLF